MENLVLEGKKYVKASVLAREFGYTTDYVGQLCRSKKVDATLVGRSWYVSETSLQDHKSNRYRSASKTSRRHLAETLAAREIATKPVMSDTRMGVQPIASSGEVRGVRRATTNHMKLNYLDDTESLLPKIQKPNLEMTTREAAAPSVPATAPRSSVESVTTTADPESLIVSLQTAPRVETPRTVRSVTQQPKRLSRRRLTHQQPVGGPPVMHQTFPVTTAVRPSTAYLAILPVVVIVAGFGAALLVGLESRVWVSNGSMHQSYHFSSASLPAAVAASHWWSNTVKQL